jgi:16S rRNA (guanine966-N2)-methyltransferase
MVREAIFSSLTSRVGVEDATVLDLYCGSGALGIEALSRGAASCTFVDSDPACLVAAKANLDAVGLSDTDATFVRGSLPAWRPKSPVDLALCDPPYGTLDVTALLEGLHADVVVLETDSAIGAYEDWNVLVERRYGGTLVTMLQHSSGEVAT